MLRWIAAWAMLLPLAAGAQDADWRAYGRAPGGGRFVPADQINRDNVARLEPVWTWHHGDMNEKRNVFECTPLVVHGVMYAITPFSNACAIDAATGEELWRFDAGEKIGFFGGPSATRGVAYWEDGDDRRIYVPTREGKLHALRADTGVPIETFGNGGTLDIRTIAADGSGQLFISSPPVVCGDTLVQGYGMEDGTFNQTPTPLVAFDARTGAERWRFNTIPQAGEFGADTWEDDSNTRHGGANVWSIMSCDPALGLIYLPVSCASFDFYGGERPGQNLFANSLVALDAKTGERRWHYQLVHHDIWDYDLPAQPILVDLTVDGEAIPAVAQITKQGFVFLFNRATGEPVFPIEERPMPASTLPGETAWPTQPVPTKPPAFTKQGLTIDELSNISPETNAALRERFSRYRSEGLFTPPSEQGSIVMPGFHGGGNWSGGTVDPASQRLYINTTEVACIAEMKPNEKFALPFAPLGWTRFRDDEGYPANAPPWGKLVCIDLAGGEIAWEVPLGEHEELTACGIPQTGQENIGGATVTAGGLVFIASTPDSYLRAFDAADGRELWKHKLPAPGYAAPISYTLAGKQYVAIAAGGGHKNGLLQPNSDTIIAFAMPR